MVVILTRPKLLQIFIDVFCGSATVNDVQCLNLLFLEDLRSVEPYMIKLFCTFLGAVRYANIKTPTVLTDLELCLFKLFL